MGTNYYCEAQKACPTCGHRDEPRHIGKSSGGWCFALHVYPDGDDPIVSLSDWEDEWHGKVIKDEYGTLVTSEAMLAIIKDRAGVGDEHDEAFMAENEAVAGPNNLWRSKIQPGHCIGHGEGTWDLCVGDFS